MSRIYRAALGVLLLVPCISLFGATEKKPQLVGNYDVRVNGAAELRRLAQTPRVKAQMATNAQPRQAAAMTSALAQIKAEVGADVRYSTVTGGVEVVRATRQPLTAAPKGFAVRNSTSDLATVLSFLHTHKDLYGVSDADINAMTFLGDSVSGSSGLHMVRLEQTENGLPVFQSETRFLLDRSGRLVRSVGLFVPAVTSVPAATAQTTPAEALASALKNTGANINPATVTTVATNPAGTDLKLNAHDASVKGDVTSKLIYFPIGPGIVVPAWLQVTFSTGADWSTVVDDATGALLYRKNIRDSAVSQQARFSVYVQANGSTPTSPAPHSPTMVTPGSGTQFPEIARTTVNMLTNYDPAASQNGWLPDGATTTTGNNVDAYLDIDSTDSPNTGVLDNNGRPVGNPDINTNNRDFLGNTTRDFDYAPAPVGGNPDAGDAPSTDPFRRGAMTQIFYDVNWYHDQLYELGFDEGAGNFQTTNFSGMGSGGDPVLAEGQDGGGTDNANFSTPPDGQSGRMQMYIFDFPTPERDGALDPDVLLHELTHGVSNRLIGDGNGLIWSPGGGMGEGWSDFFALSLQHNLNSEDPDAEYPAAAYATYQLAGLTDNYLYGIRRFPYSTNHSINPLTWADTDDAQANMSGGIPPSPLAFEQNGALEVHNIGEIWCLTLWGVRSRIIHDPAGANGDVPTGNHTMLQLVTDALKMTPINPSFADARDAVLDADCATNSCANEASIWGGFADRGLGYKAISPLGSNGLDGGPGINGTLGLGESFNVPYLDVVDPVGDVIIDDSLGNNNGAIDPGEPIKMSLNLTNPWRGTSHSVTSVTGTLTSPDVTIVGGTATWGAITAQASATGTQFTFTVPSSATAGQSLHFTLQTVSSLGTTSFNFIVRVGKRNGTDPAVTFTKTNSPGIAIPDDTPEGITDSLVVSQDLEISSLQYEVNSLPHTFTGDLEVGMHAPNGYGPEMIFVRGLFIGDSDGDNFINTLFDDNSMNDLNLSGAADAPYTGDWLPAFNSPIWSLFGIPNLGPDPIGVLGRLAGTSTLGTWKTNVIDTAAEDVGTLDQWSIIVTPTHFDITPFVAAATLGGVESVSPASGPYHVGDTLTYTLTVTNSGTAAQADDPGHEVTQALPAGLTLVSAAATSGTASANVGTNTVTWDGSLAPLGGSVVITITATIAPAAGGGIVNTFANISFDSDNNGTNDATTESNGVTISVSGSLVTGTKTVTGSFVAGGDVTYTIVLANSGNSDQADNPGNEFSDLLPASLTLVSASATSGTAVANVGTRTVTWNGSIAAGDTVTITINATIGAGAAGATISNQGSISFDSDGNGTNDATGVTNGPNGGPTTFAVAAPPVPTIGNLGLALLLVLLAAMAMSRIRTS